MMMRSFLSSKSAAAALRFATLPSAASSTLLTLASSTHHAIEAILNDLERHPHSPTHHISRTRRELVEFGLLTGTWGKGEKVALEALAQLTGEMGWRVEGDEGEVEMERRHPAVDPPLPARSGPLCLPHHCLGF